MKPAIEAQCLHLPENQTFMKRATILIVFLLSFSSSWAQPINDDCPGLIDLGEAPFCPSDVFYTNVDATPSQVGNDNIPQSGNCSSFGPMQRDVWFSFVATAAFTDYTIIATGITDGNGSIPLFQPQLALYRGDCEFDGLQELACNAADLGESVAVLDVFGLTPGLTYFIRITDYSASASPNWGTFKLCIDEYVPAINIGDTPSTGACYGTLYDSGGPDEAYTNDESHTFTICPTDPHTCIYIDLASLELGPGDFLNFYAGVDVSAPQIASLTGADNGNGFELQATSPCVTISFTSDFFTTGPGFELSWQCSPAACNSSAFNPPTINTIPFSESGTSCDDAATFNQTNCFNQTFVNGPEQVYVYHSPGGADYCLSLQLSGAEPGTGILVLNGPPDDPASGCVAFSETGDIPSAHFETEGDYYIIIANAQGCTDYTLTIEETECSLSPALVDALCNPLNGCLDTVSNLPSVFNFQQGFQDIEFNPGENDGCWLNTGSAQPNFYWFTIQAAADGPFGFIVQAADPNEASDIDINVWGPFTQLQVCDSASSVVDYINHNQPVRSTWASGPDPTGLVDIHPITGLPVTDPYDCGPGGGADGDDFCSTIQVQEGEVYAILINDWGDDIQSGNIQIDWSPSDPAVLQVPGYQVSGQDTAICAGQSVQLQISAANNSVFWEDDPTLSCTTCPDPIASPTETTTYSALINGICYDDSLSVTVHVFDVDAGPDLTVCLGEDIQIVAGSNYPNATYTWNGPAGTLSCTDCPNPIITATQPGNFTYTVTLQGPECTLSDQMNLTVLPQQAAQYHISDDQQLCTGESASLGGDAVTGMIYSWTSAPPGFNSTDPNPTVTPSETTVYYLEVQNTLSGCPIPSLDSVLVEVSVPPLIEAGPDTTICQGDLVPLGNTQVEAGVLYAWTPPDEVNDPSAANTQAVPSESTQYVLAASRNGCFSYDTLNVNVVAISVAIEQPLQDSMGICRGESLNLQANAQPAGIDFTWLPNDGSLSNPTSQNTTATPQTTTLYLAQVSVQSCVRYDSIYVYVDSIPLNRSIQPSDTVICAGELLILQSPVYEPANFPDISFQWTPNLYLLTEDTLYNLVVQPSESITYYRLVTNGLCSDIDSASVTVITTSDFQVTPSDTLICPGDTVALLAFVEDGENYSWQPTSGLSCSDCPDPLAFPSSSTTYTVSAEVAGACQVETNVQIELVPPPEYLFPDPAVLCAGESIVLNLAQAQTGYSYSWTNSSGQVFSTEAQPEVQADETQYYYLSIQNADCQAITDSILVQVISEPELSLSPDTAICLGSVVGLSANGGAPGTYSWSPTGDAHSNIEVAPQVPTTYVVSFTDAGGCFTISDSVFVDVSAGFSLSAQAEPDTVYIGQEILLSMMTDPLLNQGLYTWLHETALLGSEREISTKAPTVESESFITYTAIAIDPVYGCRDTAQVLVYVIPTRVAVPHIFTPNNDGNNDLFFLYATEGVEVLSFRIYNRWGQLVYDAGNTGLPIWDGTQNGQPAPADVYVYYIEYDLGDGQLRVLKGDVSLLR